MRNIILFGACLLVLNACGIIRRVAPKRPSIVVTEAIKETPEKRADATQTAPKATFF